MLTKQLQVFKNYFFEHMRDLKNNIHTTTSGTPEKPFFALLAGPKENFQYVAATGDERAKLILELDDGCVRAFEGKTEEADDDDDSDQQRLVVDDVEKKEGVDEKDVDEDDDDEDNDNDSVPRAPNEKYPAAHDNNDDDNNLMLHNNDDDDDDDIDNQNHVSEDEEGMGSVNGNGQHQGTSSQHSQASDVNTNSIELQTPLMVSSKHFDIFVRKAQDFIKYETFEMPDGISYASGNEDPKKLNICTVIEPVQDSELSQDDGDMLFENDIVLKIASSTGSTTEAQMVSEIKQNGISKVVGFDGFPNTGDNVIIARPKFHKLNTNKYKWALATIDPESSLPNYTAVRLPNGMFDPPFNDKNPTVMRVVHLLDGKMPATATKSTTNVDQAFRCRSRRRRRPGARISDHGLRTNGARSRRSARARRCNHGGDAAAGCACCADGASARCRRQSSIAGASRWPHRYRGAPVASPRRTSGRSLRSALGRVPALRFEAPRENVDRFFHAASTRGPLHLPERNAGRCVAFAAH